MQKNQLTIAFSLLSINPLNGAEFKEFEEKFSFERLEEEIVLKGHRDSINSVHWSPDNMLLASGSGDKTVKIWNPRSKRKCLKTFKTPSSKSYSSVSSVCWSPDGSKLASALEDVFIWNPNQTKYEAILKTERKAARTVSWSPDGKKIACSGARGIYIWDSHTAELLQKLEGHQYSVSSVCWSPDGSKLASGSLDATVKIWDYSTGECIQTLEGHQINIISVRWAPDGSKLASIADDKKVFIWDTRTLACLLRLGTQTYIERLDSDREGAFVFYEGSGDWHPNSLHFTSGSWDKEIRIWDTQAKKHTKTLSGHNDLVHSVSWSLDGLQLASGSSDNTVRVWSNLHLKKTDRQEEDEQHRVQTGQGSDDQCCIVS